MPMSETPTPANLPSARAAPSDPAQLAADVSLHLERWYQQRGLELPPEVRAEFARIGAEAVQAHPDRPRDEVLDELVGELDQRLVLIRAEEKAAGGRPGGDAPPRGLRERLRRWWH